MSVLQQYTAKWGEIETRPGKRGGIEILAMNHERGRRVSVGTVKGSVFEKGNAAILRQPEPSFCLSKPELEAAKDAGAKFLRIVTSSKQTHSISIEDFERHAERYYNAYYGEQIRCPLRFFVFADTAATRNAVLDNPKIEREAEPLPRDRQLSLFGGEGRK